MQTSIASLKAYLCILAFNWALHRPVAQSTSHDPHRNPPNAPVDGIIGAYSHTRGDNNNGHTWWLVYLERPVLIGYVVIYNRLDYGSERLSGKYVEVFDNNDRNEHKRRCGTLPDMLSTAVITMTCSPPLLGQGVEIGKEGDHKITLREVEVYEFKG